MSRLDQHVALVRNKLTLQHFIQALAWSVTAAAGAVIAAIALNRLLGLHIRVEQSREWLWLGAAGGAAALGWALWRRPSAAAAAAAIDGELQLKEKFSTALYVRSSDDPFCRAAVRDAEHTAQNVHLHRQFPWTFPRGGGWACLALLLAWCCFEWLPQCDPFGRQAQAQQKKAAQALALEQTKRPVNAGMAVVLGLPKIAGENADIRAIRQSLEDLNQKPNPSDAARDNRKAVETLDKLNKALAAQQEQVAKYAEAQKLEMKSTMDPTDDQGPIADAQNDIRNGDFAEAAKVLQKVGDNFDKMDPAEQKKAAAQMSKLAQQLDKAANDPQVQQKMQQQLQQAGMDAQQAQQMVQAMQQAAQALNDAQARQQMQQLAQQAQQQLQNQLGQLQQQAQQGNANAAQQAQQVQRQLQQLQQTMGQAQACASAQAQANSMGQAAQSMAQAMQQQQSGQGAGSGNGQAQMGQGQQAMQNALAQLQQAQQDARDLANAQQRAQQAMQQACQGGACQNQGQNNGQGNPGVGQWQAGDPGKNQGNGTGGPGIGNGLRPNIGTGTPYDVQREKDVAAGSKEGRILASTLIKAPAQRGQSTMTLHDVAAAAEQQAADEIDEEHITGQAKKAEVEYFRTMKEQPAKDDDKGTK